jgi:hypothetical protein
LNIRRNMTACLLTIGLLGLFACGLEADDFAYMLGPTTGGPTNPFGIVDLNSGAFTLIGSMGSGGYSGLAVANGVLYTEQNGLLYSVNTSNANLALIGGLTGNNFATFGSTTTGLYGLAGTGIQNVATLFSINPLTGAVTAIGPVGVIGNGQFAYARLSVGSDTLYMENNGNLYTVNTTTGAGTQVGTLDSNGYLTSVLLFENGIFYVGTGAGIGTINVTTGQITPHSSIMGGTNYVTGLAPIASSASSFFPQVAVGGGYSTIFTITNTGAGAASGTVTLTDQQANPFSVNGALTDSFGITQPATAGSSFPFAVPSGGTIFLSVTTGSAAKAGWANISSTGGTLTAVATYDDTVGSVVQSIVGVPQAQPLQYMTFPVDNDTANQLDTVYGIANPGTQPISVKLALVGQDGTVIDAITKNLNPGTQIATYLKQDFSGRTNFKGSLVLMGQNGATFVAVALQYKQNFLTVIPLISGKAPGVPN